MSLRPQYHCRRCDKTWYPQGADLTGRCPRCNGNAVTSQDQNPLASSLSRPSFAFSCLILLVLGGAFAAVISHQMHQDSGAQRQPSSSADKVRREVVGDRNPKLPITPALTSLLGTEVGASSAVIAPLPREHRWKIPSPSYTSLWQKIGLVDVRIAAMSDTHAPLVDSDFRIVQSEQSVLAVFIEVRKNEPGEKRTLLSWTCQGNHYSRMIDSANREVSHALFPLGMSVRTGLPPAQILPDDGTPVYDILLFTQPVEDRGHLELRLEAGRCGENGEFRFRIAAQAWKNRLITANEYW